MSNPALSSNVGELVQAYARAWRVGDLSAMVGCYHDDFTLHYAGRNRLAGIHAGKAKALAVLAEVSRRTNRRLVEIADVLVGDERGAILARERFSRDGREAVLERLLVYTARDGRLDACWVHESDQALADSFLD